MQPHALFRDLRIFLLYPPCSQTAGRARSDVILTSGDKPARPRGGVFPALGRPGRNGVFSLYFIFFTPHSSSLVLGSHRHGPRCLQPPYFQSRLSPMPLPHAGAPIKNERGRTAAKAATRRRPQHPGGRKEAGELNRGCCGYDRLDVPLFMDKPAENGNASAGEDPLGAQKFPAARHECEEYYKWGRRESTCACSRAKNIIKVLHDNILKRL